MDKQTADSIITSYLTKIYGFSVKHSLFYNEAEELAASIACQLYQSLLKADEVSNTDGYVMSVCRRVYSKYVEARKREQTMSLDSAEVPYEESFYEGIAAVKSGNRIGDVGHAIDSYVKKYGFRTVFETVMQISLHKKIAELQTPGQLLFSNFVKHHKTYIMLCLRIFFPRISKTNNHFHI